MALDYKQEKAVKLAVGAHFIVVCSVLQFNESWHSLMQF